MSSPSEYEWTNRVINQARGHIKCPIHGLAPCGCEVAAEIEAIREQAFDDGRDLGRMEGDPA